MIRSKTEKFLLEKLFNDSYITDKKMEKVCTSRIFQIVEEEFI